VHAFASDPTRGLFILAFLVLVIGGSLLLYAIKAPAIRSGAKFGLLSRETFLLINNILLAIALSVVLLGTLFPLASSALNLGSYSVGPPYFNAMFVPLSLPMIVLMGIAPYISWKRSNKISTAIPKWLIAAFVALLLAGLGTFSLSNQYQQDFNWLAFITLAVSLWLIVSTALHALSKAKHQQGLITGLKRLSVSYWAMVIAHCGIAVAAIGIGLTSVYEQQKDVRMLLGDDISVSGYRYQLTAINTFEGPNFSGTRGDITVFDGDTVITVLQPEKRFYYAARNVMTEAAIDPSLTRDLYVALGEELGEGAWAVRVHVKPFVRCIWLGALMMAFGGFLAVTDKRYRSKGALNV